jgi:hypothetical protein
LVIAYLRNALIVCLLRVYNENGSLPAGSRFRLIADFIFFVCFLFEGVALLFTRPLRLPPIVLEIRVESADNVPLRSCTRHFFFGERRQQWNWRQSRRRRYRWSILRDDVRFPAVQLHPFLRLGHVRYVRYTMRES